MLDEEERESSDVADDDPQSDERATHASPEDDVADDHRAAMPEKGSQQGKPDEVGPPAEPSVAPPPEAAPPDGNHAADATPLPAEQIEAPKANG